MSPRHATEPVLVIVESVERQNFIGQALGLQIAHQGTDAKRRATNALPFEDPAHIASAS